MILKYLVNSQFQYFDYDENKYLRTGSFIHKNNFITTSLVRLVVLCCYEYDILITTLKEVVVCRQPTPRKISYSTTAWVSERLMTVE